MALHFATAIAKTPVLFVVLHTGKSPPTLTRQNRTPMLILKRLITAAVLGGILFVLLFIGSMVVGGAMVGAAAAQANHATDFQSGAQAGQKAGQEFGAKYGPLFLGGSAVVAFAISVSLSFSRVLPWCRPNNPPPLPGVRNF